MAGRTHHVTELAPEVGTALRAALEAQGFDFQEVAHALWSARGAGVSATLYTSGKFVVQGKGTEDFLIGPLQEVMGLPEARLEVPTIGSDETGKGDYFGPLVVTAAALEPEVEQFLDEVQLVDSKQLSDRAALGAAERLAPILVHETVIIGPRRYNEMYASFRHLDRLLAWAHAKAIAAVIAKVGPRRVVVDRFADESVVRQALGPLAQGLELVVRPKAEDDPAVAAASILARAAFLTSLERLAKVAGQPLPKGAGEPVIRAARALYARGGEALLGEVAKLHFQTTETAKRPDR